MQPLQLGPHLDAELGVEVRQRLVQQEHLGLAHEARPIATRCRCPPESCAGLALEQFARARASGCLVHPRAVSARGILRCLQPERRGSRSTVMCG